MASSNYQQVAESTTKYELLQEPTKGKPQSFAIDHKSRVQMSLGGILERQRALPWYRVMSRENEHREYAEVMGFVVERVAACQVKMSNISKGVHIQLAELCTLLRELDSIEVPGFDILDKFCAAVQSIGGLGNTPDMEHVRSFMEAVHEVAEMHVEIGGKHKMDLLELSDIQVDCNDKGIMQKFTEVVADKYKVTEEEASAGVDAAKETVLSQYAKIGDKYSQYAVLSWLVDTLKAKVGRNDFGAMSMSWECSELPKRGMQWAALGEVIIEAIEDGCLKESDVTVFYNEATSYRKAVRQIHSEVMPLFQLRLTQLRALLETQVATSQQTKGKIMATVVTLCVTGGQFFFAKLIPYSPHCD